MITKITRSLKFIRETKRLDEFLLTKLKKQITKIMENPYVSKSLKYRRHERSLYIKPFRLIYAINNDELILLKFEHRKSIYD